MRAIVHHISVDPTRTLRVVQQPSAAHIPRDHSLVRLRFAPARHQDVLAMNGCPAFSTRMIGDRADRIFGCEGSGSIEKLGACDDPELELPVGQRVAFFPVNAAWSELVVVPNHLLVALPNDISYEIGAQMLASTITASIAIRAGVERLPADALQDITVLQIGAGSAVGLVIGTLLWELGIPVIRVVRTNDSADKLRSIAPEGPIIATQDVDYGKQLQSAVAGRQIPLAFDGTSGATFSRVTEAVSKGGTIVSYGTLGSGRIDISRLITRAQTLRGVSLDAWVSEPVQVQRADIDTALRLAREKPEVFQTAAKYPFDRIAEAIAHVGKIGRSGVVLLSA